MIRLRRNATRLSLVIMTLLGCGTLICALWSDARLPTKPRHRQAMLVEGVESLSSNTAGDVEELGWPNLFGPKLNSTSADTRITTRWPNSGPPVVWRAAIGEGYSSPVALDDQVVVFHRPRREDNDVEEGQGPSEVISCFDLATGRERWQFGHPTRFRCRTHYSSGPYSTPALDAERV